MSYVKDGYLPGHRPADVPWQDYVVLGDVVLIPRDAQVTTVDASGGSGGMQLA